MNLIDAMKRREEKVIPVGWHRCKVHSFKEIEANTGTPGVEYGFHDENGRPARSTFWTSPDAQARLGDFAIACGLPKESLIDFQIADVVGFRVDVRFDKVKNQKDGKEYINPVEFAAAGSKTGGDAVPVSHGAPQRLDDKAKERAAEIPEEEIPF